MLKAKSEKEESMNFMLPMDRTDWSNFPLLLVIGILWIASMAILPTSRFVCEDPKLDAFDTEDKKVKKIWQTEERIEFIQSSSWKKSSRVLRNVSKKSSTEEPIIFASLMICIVIRIISTISSFLKDFGL